MLVRAPQGCAAAGATNPGPGAPMPPLRPRVRKFPTPVPSCNIRAKILPSYLTGGERTPWKALRHSINSNVCHALGGNARNAWTDPKKQLRDPLVPGRCGGWFHSSQNKGCSENKGRLKVTCENSGASGSNPQAESLPGRLLHQGIWEKTIWGWIQQMGVQISIHSLKRGSHRLGFCSPSAEFRSRACA